MERKPYPSDVSDDEWALVAPYLTLITEDAPQREHSLREVFNGLRWIVRAGAAWCLMPHDLPPWHTVYQQSQRWLKAGVFDAIVQDLRAVLRLAQGRKGHPGKGPTLLSPTEVHLIAPGPCACGHGELVSLAPYYTHQGIELPAITMAIQHFILHQGTCRGCDRTLKAQLLSEHQAGYGPRLTALIGELAGRHRTSRRLIQDFCHSVFNLPISLGAVHKIIDRGSHAIVPPYEAIATLARHATVGSIDETPWYCHNAVQRGFWRVCMIPWS